MKKIISLFTVTASTLFLLFSCEKSSPVVYTNKIPDYTSKMGGTRVWHGYEVRSWYNYDTVQLQNDTFAVSVISETKIAIYGNVLSYASADSVAKTITFFCEFSPCCTSMETINVVYNYYDNTIAYDANVPTHGGGYEVILNTP